MFEEQLCNELPMLLRFTKTLGGQYDEDLVQATCEKALRCKEQFKGGNFQAWLITIMKSVKFDSLRKREYGYTHIGVEDIEIATPPDQEDRISLHEAISRLGKFSYTLPTALGYSGEEIAKIRNLTRAQVQKKVYYERQKLLKE